MSAKGFLFFVLISCLSLSLFGQEVTSFEIPERNNGHLTLKVKKGELVEINEDSAFVLSSKSFYSYRYLRNELLKYQALNEKNVKIIKGSLAKYLDVLTELDETIKTIDKLTDEQLSPIIANLTDVNNKLISDVSNLRELNEIIEAKAKELEKIEKDLQRYRWKNAWFKFADWIVAGAVGLAIGAIAL